MSDYVVIRTIGLSKAFRLSRHSRTLFRLLKGTFSRIPDGDRFFALRDINIDIHRGDKVAVVGNNGAGKSTLLRLMAGLYAPTEGEIIVKGQVTLLAALGLGMIDELTVEENIFLYGAICGVDRSVIRTNLQEIIDWAELEGFAKAKLKTLSTGMRARAAFSTTRHITGDITLMDEALTAGDKNFKQKSKSVFDQDNTNGRTFIVASHDFEFVKAVCNKTLWLEKGRQKAFGDTKSVLNRYLEAEPAVSG
jgi:ABC-type polysaccharide/polyol phosphate transport system ATPase subunit